MKAIKVSSRTKVLGHPQQKLGGRIMLITSLMSLISYLLNKGTQYVINITNKKN